MLNANTREACAQSGMPMSHARCFQQVANETNCVIASRSVGIYATGLILENYATKGFHVKAKSCNWGPMAGFVLSDPRFTKRGTSASAMEAQRKDVQKALNADAQETQVFISDARRKEVENNGWMRRAGGEINAMKYSATSPDGKSMDFILQREFEAPGANGMQMFAVHYAAGQTSMPSSPTAPNQSTKDHLLPVMALVDPLCDKSVRSTYREAMTGDYDLWAVFPAAHQVQPRGLDQRPVQGSERFRMPISAFIQQEDPHMGNITGRAADIKNRLNTAIRAAGYTGGNMVHHSDEAGRPMVDEVELEFIAFVPRHTGAYFVGTKGDLADFFKLVIHDYSITLNPGWQSQLGFSATPGGNWEV